MTNKYNSFRPEISKALIIKIKVSLINSTKKTEDDDWRTKLNEIHYIFRVHMFI